MSNSVSFHSQLASIMEVLTKTAVAEICELVDDGYAVLHLEISRSRKENEALKRKLQMMELKIARSCSFSRSGIVKFSSESRATASVASSIVPESHFPTADHLFPKRLGSSLWIHGNPAAVNEDPAPVHSEIGHEASYIEEERPKPIIIKEERLEEDGDRCNSQEELKISEERVEWLTTEGVGTSPLVDKQTTPIPGIEELPEQHMTRRTVWEDSDTVLRAESENDSLNAGHQRRGPVQSSGKLDNMDYEYDLYGRPGQTDTFFALGNPETETEGAACSYTTETNSESLLVHSEIQTAAATKGGSDSLTSLRSLEPKSGVGMMDSAPFEMEFEISPAWNKGSVSAGAYMQHRHYKKDLLSVKPQPENVPNMFPTNSLTTQSRVGMKDKRFICTYCGKSFSSPQNLDTHHRIHTGERPFMCTQCGKRFTQSAHLKSHQSVHTGERPFECTDCGKRFSGKQNLRIHQQKNHSRPPK